jgi:(2Fe-2S) ferredoxin
MTRRAAASPVYGRAVPPRPHLFVCTNRRPDGGRAACGSRGGEQVYQAVVAAALAARAPLRITPCGCLGPCFDGPNAILYPTGVTWTGLTPADAASLVAAAGGDECADLAARRWDVEP